MKRIVALLSVLLIVLYCTNGVISVFATGYSRFDTEAISEKEQTEFLDNIQFVPSLDFNPVNEPISYFAISPQGQIALGFNDSDYASVHVYDATGNFLYGYRFENHFCSFALLFNEENLTIIWDQSDYIGSFDRMGNCIQLRQFSDTKNNADEEYKEQWRSATGTIGTLSYHAKRSGILPKYTAFKITDSKGHKTVIYDVHNEVITRNTLLGIGVVCFLAFVAYGVFYQDRQKKADNKADDGAMS